MIWETGAFGILEPKEEKGRTAVGKIGSLNTCSRRFVRSGGKKDRIRGGFYDTYLRKIEECHTFGLAFEVQMADQIPAGAHDIRMEYA